MRYTQAKVHYKGLKKDYNETMEKVSLLFQARDLELKKYKNFKKEFKEEQQLKQKIYELEMDIIQRDNFKPTLVDKGLQVELKTDPSEEMKIQYKKAMDQMLRLKDLCESLKAKTRQLQKELN